MAENTNRTFICSVLFLDIVGYSQWKVADQIALKERFNSVLSGAIAGVATDDRIILDTGDGAAVSFLGDPEDAVFAGMALRDAVANQEVTGGPRLQTRVGINLGPVRVVKDINGQPNIIGDGINVAQRVMSFAEPGQILVSRSYYDIMARLSDDYANLFHYEGAKTDKHVREHEVYAIDSAPSTLRRPVHTPPPRPGLRLPKLQFPRLPRLSSRSLAGALALNSKLFVAAPLAFTLIVGTGVIARSYRTTNSEVKSAAVTAPPPPRVAVAPQADLAPAGGPAEAAPKAQGPAAPPKPAETAASQQRPKAAARLVRAKPPAEASGPKAVEPAPAQEAASAPKTREPETVALAAPAPRDASIKILAFPWAEVFVDGQRQGVSPPLRAIPIKPGRHRVELRNSSFPAHVETVEVKSGAEVSVRHRFRR
ncbi:MAG: adenylate/guanylate cyclase domain-containing protein [Burkholderiales bacterium]